ncbi:unnamed protein product [Haemonchus placei]|uniref:Carboxylic ester hydrolase n=1 Tax=Haemonchus placei TaxID=6290 RepID=A0A0N4WHP5_HAEPC|nr:unnamed protein product [Haemonchus placei]
MWLPLATLLLTALSSTAAREVVVKTSRGSLVGYQSVSSSGKLVNIFKQIPYAEPPVGELRFQRPHEVRKWNGIRDATEYGPACMSNSSTTTSPQKWVDEDCLHLNIFASADCLVNPCPVAFYIHGGGFNYDSAVMFKDEALVDNFGGNDLLAALQFVRKEIHHFGGDPGNVALMGHSGGAVAVAQLAFSKQIDPDVKLFQKGIIMSMAFGFSDESHMQNLTTELAYRAECLPTRTSVPSSKAFTEGVVHCLRQIQREMEDEDENLKPEGFIMAKPLFDADDLQDFIRDPPPRAIMTGTTVHEFDNSLKVDVRPIMSLLGMNNTDEIVAKYRQDFDGRKLPFNHTTETQTIFVSTYVVGHSMRAAGGETYLYSYKNPRHAKHTDDLSYIMGVHMFEQDANEKVLAVVYPKLFTDFIKSGRPRKDWTPLHRNLDNYMHIDVNVDDETLPHMALGYEKEVMDYWKTMKAFDESLTKLKERVAETREMDSPFRSNDRTPTIMLISIPIVVVVCAVLVIGYVVRQRQRRRTHPGKPDETTPLVSGNPEAGMPQPNDEWK